MADKLIYLCVHIFSTGTPLIYPVSDLPEIMDRIKFAAEQRNSTFTIKIELVEMTKEEFEALEDADETAH